MPGTSRVGPGKSLALRGNALLPNVLLVVGIGAAVYLAFSVLIGLLMTLLMVAGGVALLYAAFRLGRWQGRRDSR